MVAHVSAHHSKGVVHLMHPFQFTCGREPGMSSSRRVTVPMAAIILSATPGTHVAAHHSKGAVHLIHPYTRATKTKEPL